MKNKSRRKFLKTLAKASLGVFAFPNIVPASALGKNGFIAPSNRISLGFCGVGIHGYGVNLMNFKNIKEAQVAMLCDVDLGRVKTAKEKLSKEYKIEVADKDCCQDFRKVLDNPAIDAVVISTPDHWHTTMSVMALRKGKHVFSEKPTISIEEGEILEREVRQSGLVFQAGIEDRTLNAYVKMLNLARNGYLGKIESAHVGIPVKPSSFKYIAKREDKIPEDFDYDLWLGPAEYAPYQVERCHYNFRWQKAYSIGFLTDWGTHMFDIAQLAIDGDKPQPISVEPLSETKYLKGLFDNPYDFSLRYDYKSGGRIFVDTGETHFRITGDKGWVESPNFPHNFSASSPQILEAFLKPQDNRYRSEKLREHQNFIDNIRFGRALFMPASALKDLCFSLCSGSIAMALNRKINIVNGKFAAEPAADALRKREYRKSFNILHS